MKNVENENDSEFNYTLNKDNDHYTISFYSKQNNKKNKSEKNLLKNNSNQLLLSNNFFITNKAHLNNFYTNHKKTMIKLRKYNKLNHNKNNTMFLNKLNYSNNKKNYHSYLNNNNCLSNSIEDKNKNFIEKKNKKYRGYLLPIHNLSKKKDELFPLFNHLNTDTNIMYKQIIQNNNSYLLKRNKNLKIDNEIENVKIPNYITNDLIKDRKDYFETIKNNIKSNNKDIKYLKEKKQLNNNEFYQKEIRYKILKKFKINSSNPIERYKLKDYFKDYTKIKNINIF